MGVRLRPFDSYPTDEAQLRQGLRGRDNCRHGYGLDLQIRTGQTRCAYCGLSLVDNYYHRLLLCVDHVVPVSEARRLGIPDELAGGLANQVLCCAGCNGFANRYSEVEEEPRESWTLEGFIELRNRVFARRQVIIAQRRAAEMEFFDRRPWEVRSKA